jgi:hypothetical protein
MHHYLWYLSATHSGQHFHVTLPIADWDYRFLVHPTEQENGGAKIKKVHKPAFITVLQLQKRVCIGNAYYGCLPCYFILSAFWWSAYKCLKSSGFVSDDDL